MCSCACVCARTQMLNCTEREDEIRKAGQQAVSHGASLEASVLVCWVCKTVSTFRQMRAATVDSFNQTIFVPWSEVQSPLRQPLLEMSALVKQLQYVHFILVCREPTFCRCPHEYR